MKQIWIAETGEYEQRYTSFVADSPESAVAYLMAEHPEGQWKYVVEVREAIMRDGEVYVEGFTDHKIIGFVYVYPPHNMTLSRHDFDLSLVDYAHA